MTTHFTFVCVNIFAKSKTTLCYHSFWLLVADAICHNKIWHRIMFCVLPKYDFAELNPTNFTPGLCFSLAAGDKSEMPPLLSKIVVAGQAFHIKPTILIMDFSSCSYLYQNVLILYRVESISHSNTMWISLPCVADISRAKALKW